MNSINERFTELRKSCNKNQSDWAKIIGISRSGIAAIEAGQRKVTEKHLIMLSNWGEHNVNIDWLRTGRGEMFLPKETDTLRVIQKEYQLTDPQFKLISNFLRLPEKERNIIVSFLRSAFVENIPDETVSDSQTEPEDEIL